MSTFMYMYKMYVSIMYKIKLHTCTCTCVYSVHVCAYVVQCMVCNVKQTGINREYSVGGYRTVQYMHVFVCSFGYFSHCLTYVIFDVEMFIYLCKGKT